ncbi:nucleotide sugar dehydrogenase [Neomoorella thermoacetica]|uniref:nucleotide sugar dehydrogenase n=1 Tax=Neomoorella thermoacetica TaxID=1525 RepID=UPI0008FA575C|nr:UDP-N-acetyl-D-glucosamine 6-dehydrogenase [Moorella thermoacetica]
MTAAPFITEAFQRAPKDSLLQKIKGKSAVVGVVGLGYVGLPLALEIARAGYRVIGIEENPFRVQKVNRGESYITDVPDQELQSLVKSGAIAAVNDFSCVPAIDIIIICVPTPLTRNLVPDLQYVENVTRSIATGLRRGQLVSLESTTYPGTVEEVILPILESSGLKAEIDFFLVHSPERVDPGNKRYTTRNTSKVIGAIGPASLEVALSFYSQTVEKVVPVSSTRAAELVKVFENTFRAVNIALVNELAMFCDLIELNVWEVLDAAFTKPFGIIPFYPGPGVGGHCIPVDPHYLEWKARELNFNTRFIALAGEINRKMPEFVQRKALRILNNMGIPASRAQILVLGVAYKKDVADSRESPAIQVIRLLLRDGASVLYHDELVKRIQDRELDMASTPLSEEVLRASDLVIITTDHSHLDYQWVVEKAKHVLDTRNATLYVANNRERITLL